MLFLHAFDWLGQEFITWMLLHEYDESWFQGLQSKDCVLQTLYLSLFFPSLETWSWFFCSSLCCRFLTFVVFALSKKRDWAVRPLRVGPAALAFIFCRLRGAWLSGRWAPFLGAWLHSLTEAIRLWKTLSSAVTPDVELFLGTCRQTSSWQQKDFYQQMQERGLDAYRRAAAQRMGPRLAWAVEGCQIPLA